MFAGVTYSNFSTINLVTFLGDRHEKKLDFCFLGGYPNSLGGPNGGNLK
jgi:hypothetical protein